MEVGVNKFGGLLNRTVVERNNMATKVVRLMYFREVVESGNMRIRDMEDGDVCDYGEDQQFEGGQGGLYY